MDALHPDTQLGVIHLRVRDLAAVGRFYRHELGLQALSETGNHLVLGAGDRAILQLEGDAAAAEASKRATGLYHFAILLPSRADLALFLKHIEGTSARLQGFADHLVSEAVYLEDPEGNGIEVYADRPRAEWKMEGRSPRMATLPLDQESLLREIEQPDLAWRKMPAGSKLGHVHLHVSDLHETGDFYERALGFARMGMFGEQAMFLAAGGYHHHIGINTWLGPGAPNPPAGTVGLKWFSVELVDQAELERVASRLRASGHALRTTEDGSLARDPSNHGVLLTVRSEG